MRLQRPIWSILFYSALVNGISVEDLDRKSSYLSSNKRKAAEAPISIGSQFSNFLAPATSRPISNSLQSFVPTPSLVAISAFSDSPFLIQSFVPSSIHAAFPTNTPLSTYYSSTTTAQHHTLGQSIQGSEPILRSSSSAKTSSLRKSRPSEWQIPNPSSAIAAPTTRTKTYVHSVLTPLKSVHYAVNKPESTYMAVTTPYQAPVSPASKPLADTTFLPKSGTASSLKHFRTPLASPRTIALLSLDSQGNLVVPSAAGFPPYSLTKFPASVGTTPPIADLSTSIFKIGAAPTTSAYASPSTGAATSKIDTSGDSDGSVSNISESDAASGSHQGISSAVDTDPSAAGLSKTQKIGVGVAVPSAALVVVAAVFFALQKSRRSDVKYYQAGEADEKDSSYVFGKRSGFHTSILKYTHLRSNDNPGEALGHLKLAKTKYNSGAYTISSPVPGSLRENAILPFPLFAYANPDSTINYDIVNEEAYPSRRSPFRRSDSALHAQTRKLLSSLGTGMSKPISLRDEEAAVDHSHVESAPKGVQLHDQLIAQNLEIPKPPPFTPRQLKNVNLSPALLRQPNDYNTQSDQYENSLAILRPPPPRRSMPKLHLKTAHPEAHAFATPLPLQAHHALRAQPRLGNVSRNSVSHNRVGSDTNDAAEITSIGASVVSERDTVETPSQMNPGALWSSSIIGATANETEASGDTAIDEKTAATQQSPHQHSRQRPFSSLRRTRAVRHSPTGSINRRPASTIYSATSERIGRDEWLETDDERPLMSPEQVDQHVADLREIARGRSVRSSQQ